MYLPTGGNRASYFSRWSYSCPKGPGGSAESCEDVSGNHKCLTFLFFFKLPSAFLFFSKCRNQLFFFVFFCPQRGAG